MTRNFRLTAPISLFCSLGSVVLSWGGLLPAATAQSLLYPSTQAPNGIMVTGVGIANTEPDTAELTMTIGKGDPFGFMNSAEASEEPAQPPRGVTEADLRPIVSALSNTGIPISSVKTYTQDRSTARPSGFAPPGTGTIVVKVAQPTRPILKTLVDAVDKAATQAKLRPQTIRVSYSLQNCSTLELQAYEAALKNAQQRAKAIAQTLKVTLAEAPAVAEAFYSTFYPSPCNSEPTAGFGGPTYSSEPFNDDRDPKVTLRKDLFVTYKLK